MKSRQLLIIFIIVLIVLGAYFGIFRTGAISEDSLNIQLQDTSAITSFTVESGSIKIEVAKKGQHWMVNDVYHANEQLVKRVLRIFKNLNISLFVVRDSIDGYVENLQSKGVKLQFFEGDEKEETYWIGSFDDTRKATLIMNSEHIPIYASAPGLSSDIQKFVVADDIFWRDKRIFDFEPSEISKIGLTDYRNSSGSFTIEIKDEEYKLVNKNNETVDFDPESISRYLSYFRNVRFEALEEKYTANHLDSVINQAPLYSVKVELIDRTVIELTLIQKSDSNNVGQPDLNNVYGLLNKKKPLIIITYFSIDPVLKNINYFKPKN